MGSYADIEVSHRYAPWQTDVEFVKVYSQVKTHTLVDVYRLFELWSLVKQSANSMAGI